MSDTKKSPVQLVDYPLSFAMEQFRCPEAHFYPGYFWLWNGRLDERVLAEQLRDMREHEARSVCALPMPREFRTLHFGSLMDADYLSPEFFGKVRFAVEESARLGMNYWLYDEGGWPSGLASGRVAAANPDLAAVALSRDEAGEWRPTRHPGRTDLLNPETTRTFIALTYERYRDAVGQFFGTTIRFAFTDEPAVPGVVPGRQIPWTNDAKDDFARRFGYRIDDCLDAFAKLPGALTRDDMRVRVDFFDWWSARFQSAYFRALRDWCRAHGLLFGGHLGGEDETMGAIRHGFGHVLRMLREMDLPGVDVIWQQVFPGKPNHHFPKYAASTAHQNGVPFVFTESYAVYGNGITIEQMKWILDYQFVRGVNMLVLGCYPMSTRDHHIAGLRPHFGRANPLWDYMPHFHRYAARVGYALSCGEPIVDAALYYPVRDMWATGTDDDSVKGYEALAEALLRRQCEFDLIDDDLLGGGDVDASAGLRVGRMSYRWLVTGPSRWLADRGVATIARFVRAGGRLLCLGGIPEVAMDGGARMKQTLGPLLDRVAVFADADALARTLPQLVELAPPTDGIRVTGRRLSNGALYFLFNEGQTTYRGRMYVVGHGRPKVLDPFDGSVSALQHDLSCAGRVCVPLELAAGQSALLLLDDTEAKPRPTLRAVPGRELVLDSGWEARTRRRFDVGPHDYEIRETPSAEWQPMGLGRWRERFGADFSGDVVYRTTVQVPKDWQGGIVRLELGEVEYAARVRVNGTEIATLVCPPWSVEMQDASGRFELEITVTNTLANVIASDRVRRDWAGRRGPGWEVPYDRIAIPFEQSMCGGGLIGPVVIRLLERCTEPGA